MTNARTQYIQSLVYDLNKLLAVNLQPSSQPAYDPRAQEPSGDVIVTTVTPRNLTNSLSENSLLSPSTGVIYPGAIVMQDQNLANGTPTPYTLARGPLRIYVDLAGLGDKAYTTIESPTNVSVATAVQNIVNYWLDNVQSKAISRLCEPIQSLKNRTRNRKLRFHSALEYNGPNAMQQLA